MAMISKKTASIYTQELKRTPPAKASGVELTESEILDREQKLVLAGTNYREQIVRFLCFFVFSPNVATRRCEAAPTRTRTPLQPEKEKRKCWLHETWCSRKRALKPIGVSCDTWWQVLKSMFF